MKLLDPPSSKQLKNIFYQIIQNPYLPMEGMSMSPTILKNWKIQVSPSDISEIKFGDILIFYSDRLICHRFYGRIKWKKRNFLIHRGDAKRAGYDLLREEAFVGKVINVFDERGGLIELKKWQWSSMKKLWQHFRMVLAFTRYIFRKIAFVAKEE